MKRFLIIRLSHLGDIILTEPVVRSISETWPDAEIDFLTKSSYRDVVDLFSGIDKVLTLDIPGNDSSILGLLSKLRAMSLQRYDATIDLHGNLRSWLAKYQIRSRQVVTYHKNRFARSNAVRRKLHAPAIHTVDLYLSALKKLNVPCVSRVPTIELSPSRQDKKSASSESSRYIVFAVGASHPTKHFPLDQWVELGMELWDSLHAQIVVVEEEQWQYLNVFDELVDAGHAKIVTGLPIKSLANLIAGSLLTISNDSGIMHLSAALGVPTVGLFGPTHPVLGFSPLGGLSRAVSVDAECSPCSLHGESPCYREERFCFTRMRNDVIMRTIKGVLQGAGI